MLTGSIYGQPSPQWRLLPAAGYDAGSESAYASLSLGRSQPRKWLPDQLEYEMGYVWGGSAERFLAYTEYLWDIGPSSRVLTILLGFGAGIGVRSSRDLDGLAGYSVRFQKELHKEIRASLDAGYIHASNEPHNLVPITLGISFPLGGH